MKTPSKTPTSKTKAATKKEISDALKYATSEIEYFYELAKNGLRTSKGKMEVVISIGQFGRLDTLKQLLEKMGG